MKASQMLRLGFGVLAISALGTELAAQQKQEFIFKAPPGISKYEEQHAVDVGDVEDHQLRVYSLHTTYAQQAPVYNGVKVRESWLRASSDYTKDNGHTYGYTVFLLENSDKIFGRWEAITQTTINADGSKVTMVNSVTILTGGTGKLRGIRGSLREVAITDFNVVDDSLAEGEYWIEQ